MAIGLLMSWKLFGYWLRFLMVTGIPGSLQRLYGSLAIKACRQFRLETLKILRLLDESLSGLTRLD